MYAIKVVCKQALDQDGYSIVREDEVMWLVEDECGCLYAVCDRGEIPEEVKVFYTHKDVEDFMSDGEFPWHIKPKSFEIMQVEPVYETKIVGWKKTSPRSCVRTALKRFICVD